MTQSADHKAAIRISAADPLELQEQRALAACRVRQARGWSGRSTARGSVPSPLRRR